MSTALCGFILFNINKYLFGFLNALTLLLSKENDIVTINNKYDGAHL